MNIHGCSRCQTLAEALAEIRAAAIQLLPTDSDYVHVITRRIAEIALDALRTLPPAYERKPYEPYYGYASLRPARAGETGRETEDGAGGAEGDPHGK